jgi:hypothetical protein
LVRESGYAVSFFFHRPQEILMRNFMQITIGGAFENNEVRKLSETYRDYSMIPEYALQVRKHYQTLRLPTEERKVWLSTVTFEELHEMNNMKLVHLDRWEDIRVANYLAEGAGLKPLSVDVCAYIHALIPISEFERTGYYFVTCGMYPIEGKDQYLRDRVLRFKRHEPLGYYPATHVVRTAVRGGEEMYGCLIYETSGASWNSTR